MCTLSMAYVDTCEHSKTAHRLSLRHFLGACTYESGYLIFECNVQLHSGSL